MSPLSEDDFRRAAATLGCDVPAIKAVAEVESSGRGFLNDGRLRVLFEGHQFFKYTKGAYAATNPDICHPKWTRTFYATGDPETRGAGELARLERAKQLDKKAALMSCSIGKFQVMGFNFALCGFKSVEEFWAALGKDEGNQLDAFCCYVKEVGLDDDLRAHNWAEFARRYNGPEYKKNRYDEKLSKAHAKYAAQSLPESSPRKDHAKRAVVARRRKRRVNKKR
jgi:hypothetical protein